MIYPCRDAEGIRLVLDQMLEREHELLRATEILKSMADDQKARFLASLPKVTLSPGYERWAQHLMLLERFHKLGLPLGDLMAVEFAGLELLDRARNAHRYKHPTCYACGMPQDNRFLVECTDCGAKFRKRK